MAITKQLSSPELQFEKVSKKTHKGHRNVCNTSGIQYVLFRHYLGTIQAGTAACK